MLELKKITKVYNTGGFTQKALDKVSVSFRENEFVSILGPSGSGKTTLLNIIGGLDKYTSGDLIINGVSTKNYKDANWDTYRNHRVGFVFQSYNLINHQNVLANVELALTLSGVGKKERKKRAIAVLEKVGLKDHLNKKPNQLSGGQMQRVAIARALINNPDILLADEPTGALDTETSKQIMELLKEIAKDKLVIMVTHNPELAEEYSTRIVQIKDGKVLSDTDPFEGSKEKEDKEVTKQKSKKTSMSFFTALSLSLNNLMTKKGRTILTSFAGSIGIIGIALILSLSSGVQAYIDKVQEDTLSSYPLIIQEQSVDMATLMLTMAPDENISHEEGKIYSNDIMADIMSGMSQGITTNDLTGFKKYLENNKDTLNLYSNDIKYSYNVALNIYKADANPVLKVNPTTILESLGMGGSVSTGNGTSISMSNSATDVWTELTSNKDLLKSQYDIIEGRLPEAYNEVVLTVDQNNEISDYALYALGIKNQTEIAQMLSQIMKGEKVEVKETNYTYEELMNTKYKLVLNTDYFVKENGYWQDKSKDFVYMSNLVENSEDISIVGIIRPKEDANISATSGGIGYTSELTKYLITKINESEIAKEQLENPEINVFTKQPFANTESLVENKYVLGLVDLDSPSAISIFPKNFEAKDKIIDLIEEYNLKLKEEGKEEITYTDYVALLMDSVTTIVNMISYVLIAFVAISLVVSSIMIGIITYISVLERTKEIGILRAIGASKKDISRVFNAETFIIGLGAGLLGIMITIILNIPINAIIREMTGIEQITKLPTLGAIILVIISMVLTIIAGLIPSRFASKKDPVEALRTE